MFKKNVNTKQKPVETAKKPKREVSYTREYFELISETLVYVFFVMTFLLQSFVIPTGSMLDNILIGDHILVDKVAYSDSIGTLDHILLPQREIHRGMIVTFKSPPEIEKEYVKRVIGEPGDRIKIINKKVYINDNPLDEPYTFFKDPEINNSIRDNMPEYQVPPDHYFCMGDNRDNSYDSRFWGPVPRDYIVGKPWRIYWSYESNTEDYVSSEDKRLRDKLWDKAKDTNRTIWNFPQKTRWKRTGQKVE